MKKIIEFIVFEKDISKLKALTPDLNAYKSMIIREYYDGDVNLKGRPRKVKKVLPLKSLRFTNVWSALGEVMIQFDKDEFRRVMNNSVKKAFAKFVIDYKSNSILQRYVFYNENKESLLLLIDAMESEYYLEEENEVVKLIGYLSSENNSIDTKSISKDDVRKRMKVELEFIEKQLEKKEFDIQINR